MRLVLVALFILLGANLMIELLDSNLTETLNERRESIERLTNPPSTSIQ